MAWLLAWVWQGLGLAAGVTLVLRVARSTAASTRFVLWWGTLIAVLVLPLAPLAGDLGRDVGHAGLAPSSMVAWRHAPSGSEPLLPFAFPAPPDWAAAIAVGAWLGFVLVSLLHLHRAGRHLAALKRRAVPVSRAREERLPLWMAVRAGGRAVALTRCDGVAAPAALGLGRPMVVVPGRILDQLGDEELDQVVLHEYGHLERRDDWTRLAEMLVRAFFGFHPAIWWIVRQLELEREAACDDFVVRHTGAARRYAACLARAAELAAGAAGSQALVHGMRGVSCDLGTRVRRLLDGRSRHRRGRSGAAVVAAGTMGLAAGLTVLPQARPLVVFASPVHVATPAVAHRPAVGSFGVVPIEPVESLVRLPVSPRPSAPPPVEAARLLTPTRTVEDATVNAPVPVARRLRWRPTEDPALAATTLAAVLPSAAVPGRSTPTASMAGAGDARGPWLAVADAGTAVGSGVRKAGVTTAGFFTRLGRSIGEAF